MPTQTQTNQLLSKENNFGYAPVKGPRSLPVTIDFSVGNPITLNMTEAVKSAQLEFIQCIYCDNSANPNPFSITDSFTFQKLTWPAFSQGYLPFLTPTYSNFICATTGNTAQVPIQLLTYPVPAAVWQPDRSVVITGSAGVDGSGTITTGGTAQNIFGATIPTNGFGVYNPDAANDLWVSDSTTAAANAAGSIRVAANGGWYETPPGYKPIAAPSIVGAVNGQKYTARRW